jgi:hypothetical protein
MVTMDEVRAFAGTLPRSSEALVRGRVKVRIGRIVYLSFSRDGSTMGFAFPKEWRAALVESEPDKFSLPSESDMRYHWVLVSLAAISVDRLHWDLEEFDRRSPLGSARVHRVQRVVATAHGLFAFKERDAETFARLPIDEHEHL